MALPETQQQQNFTGQIWAQFFDQLVQFFSTGDYKDEILKAKEIFFEKLGRSHELQESYYESVSQSFLEWYIYDYHLSKHEKSPAIVFLSLKMGREEERELLKKTLFHHWSLFRVEEFSKDVIVLEDLLFRHKRTLRVDSKAAHFSAWKVKKNQIIQARLFCAEEAGHFWVTHLWLHPESEYKLLKVLCQNLIGKWGLHREFLRHCLECLVRSFGLQDQMAAVRAQNWIYQELKKRYAQKSGH